MPARGSSRRTSAAWRLSAGSCESSFSELSVNDAPKPLIACARRDGSTSTTTEAPPVPAADGRSGCRASLALPSLDVSQTWALSACAAGAGLASRSRSRRARSVRRTAAGNAGRGENQRALRDELVEGEDVALAVPEPGRSDRTEVRDVPGLHAGLAG